ncbi:MAG: FecR domain-containing protein [Candidatus Riflebacteria bacterium]|nr:FecR domain-containing protein [Candidatus Riflebacteria bacterium]
MKDKNSLLYILQPILRSFPLVDGTLLMVCLIGMIMIVAGCGGGGGTSPVASLKAVQGKVEIRPVGASTFAAAAAAQPLVAGSAVRTGEDGQAQIQYADGTDVAIQPETFYEIKSQNSLGRQESGSARYRVSPQQNAVSVETPHGVTAVLGTVFRLDVTAQQTVVTLQEGKVRFTAAAGGSVELTPGQQVTAPAGAAPGKPAELDPFTLESLFNPGSKAPAINQR